jgi:DNA gyrase subunit A
LLKALANLDDVITILRQAADGSTAKMTLCSRLDLSELQADAILSMPLRRLTSLEQQNLQEEFEQLNREISVLRTLLEDRRELLKALKKDLRSLKRKYNDPRRTKIVNTKENPVSEEKDKTGVRSQEKKEIRTEVPKLAIEETILEVTQRGYVRRISPSSKKLKGENGLLDHDFIIQTELTNTHKDLLILTSSGKVYPITVGDIPVTTGRAARGTPLITMLTNTAQGNTEGVISRFLLPEKPETQEMVLLTKEGRIKRLSLSEFVNLSRRGITILKLKDNDELAFTQFITSGQHIILASSSGRLLRFPVNDEQLPIMGRAAMGLQAFRLLKNQQMVGCVNLNQDHKLLLVTQEGFAGSISWTANQLRVANRGDLGIQILKFHNKTDNLAAMVQVKSGREVALMTNKDRVIRVSVDTIPGFSKDSKGESICQLNRDEKIIAVVEIDV